MTSFEEARAAGDANRRAVLGNDHVDRASRSADPFTAPMQDLVTRVCWGEVWGDERLPRHIRSLLNVVMMVALDRQHELALHTRGALNNGVSEDELQAALMHAMVYCGVPAGMEAFRTVATVLADQRAAVATTED